MGASQIPELGSISFEEKSKNLKPFAWGYGSTERTSKLREVLLDKAVLVKDWTELISGLGVCTFRNEIRLDMDRARIVTRVHKQNQGKPPVIRMAMATEALCEEMPIFIKEGELIVGDANSAADEIRWHPEVSVSWVPDAINGGYKHMLSEEEKAEALEIAKFWEDKSREAEVKAVIPDSIMPYTMRTPDNPSFYVDHWCEGRQIFCYDFDVLFNEGMKARLEKVEKKLAELEKNAEGMTPKEYITKRQNWEAMSICGRGIIRFAERHSELAKQLAEAEEDKDRKMELEEIAEICKQVPANSPRTLQEAIQFLWFIDLVGKFLAVPGNASGVRLDQVWWPYYKADMESGKITRERAVELVECWMMKVHELGAHAEKPQLFSLTSGGEVFYTSNICGSKPKI